MKKSFLGIFLICLLVTACGNTSASKDVPGTEQTATQTKVSELASIDTICSYLSSKNLISGGPTPVAANMIGAENGIKYADSNFEIYEYNTSSDKYKDLVNTGSTTIDGLNVKFSASAINGKYIIYCDEASNKDKIINSFKELK